jgi:predicted nucleic acid-binding protein
MKYIVDTHSLVWYLTKDKRLSSKVKKILKEAEQGRNEVILPAIVLLEAIDIQEKKRIHFKIEKLFDFIEKRDNFTVIGLDFAQIKEIAKIGKGLDLHDRVILAIGKLCKGVILTKDPEIKKLTKTIW